MLERSLSINAVSHKGGTTKTTTSAAIVSILSKTISPELLHAVDADSPQNTLHTWYAGNFSNLTTATLTEDAARKHEADQLFISALDYPGSITIADLGANSPPAFLKVFNESLVPELANEGELGIDFLWMLTSDTQLKEFIAFCNQINFTSRIFLVINEGVTNEFHLRGLQEKAIQNYLKKHNVQIIRIPPLAPKIIEDCMSRKVPFHLTHDDLRFNVMDRSRIFRYLKKIQAKLAPYYPEVFAND